MGHRAPSTEPGLGESRFEPALDVLPDLRLPEQEVTSPSAHGAEEVGRSRDVNHHGFAARSQRPPDLIQRSEFEIDVDVMEEQGGHSALERTVRKREVCSARADSNAMLRYGLRLAARDGDSWPWRRPRPHAGPLLVGEGGGDLAGERAGSAADIQNSLAALQG